MPPKTPRSGLLPLPPLLLLPTAHCPLPRTAVVPGRGRRAPTSLEVSALPAKAYVPVANRLIQGGYFLPSLPILASIASRTAGDLGSFLITERFLGNFFSFVQNLIRLSSSLIALQEVFGLVD